MIVLADVIEHLEDPAAALDACAGLLADGGVLCVITPDPSTPRRPRGRRALVGLRARAHLPAAGPHAARAADARGLVISDDVALVRSFALRYWLAGLSERGGRGGRGAAPARRDAARRPPRLARARRRARSCSPTASPSCARPSRSPPTAATPPRVTVVLPAYRAASTIPAVASQLPVDVVDRALLVDDASPDTTPEVALREGFELLRLPANRGYGGNQKAGYVRALLDGADIVVMVHADNQYDPSLVERMVRPLEAGHRRRRDGLAAARGRDDRGRDAALEVDRQPRADRGREPRVQARLLRVPHGLPRLLGRLPAPRRVPAQLRRLRVRPGDVRPDRGEPEPRGRAADPDALLPRGLERLVPRLRALRRQDAVGARPLPPAPARPPLAGARAPARPRSRAPGERNAAAPG